MKVRSALFYGSLAREGCSGAQRLWAMRRNGVEVLAFDKTAYRRDLSGLHRLAAKGMSKPLWLWEHQKLAADFLKACADFRPDLVWVEWAREMAVETLEKARKILPHALFVSMQDDNPWGARKGDRWIWGPYFKSIEYFDLHLVKRASDVDHIAALGGKHSEQWWHGIYCPVFSPGVNVVKRYPVSFVGTCMDGRDELIASLLDAGIEVHVFGTHWEKRSKLPGLFKFNFHPAVRGNAYAQVIRESHICLGLVSHSNLDEWTMRSYEVPGCGGLLLAERTPVHEEMFREGIDSELFGSNAEAVTKATMLLRDPSRCAEMGAAARDRFLERGWTLENQMAKLLRRLNEHIGF